MTTFVFTLKRSLLPGSIADQQHELEIGATNAVRARHVEKTEKRARGGATETLYHRADVEWAVTFEPVNGVRLDELIEFLDSTESGEPFAMQLYGTESTMTSVMRTDNGYQLSPFMAVGGERTDYFQTQISVRAV